MLKRPITVFACDIDGCLAAADHAPYDLEALGRMAAYNARVADDPSIPALTLVTGRPHSYADAVSQVLGVDLPYSFENGAGLATRRPYRARLSPASEHGQASLQEFTARLEGDPRFTLQLGKVASLSVFPADPQQPQEQQLVALRELLDEGDHDLLLDPSTGCVNVLLPGVDKASGFRWLLEEAGLVPEEVAGIGDSVGDLGWLARCGLSLAPGNAVPEVLAAVDVRLPGPDVGASLAAYEALIAANRRLLQS